MIELQQVSLQRGSRVLLEGADLRVHAGDKLGLVGPNGSGKSTLFALLRGQLQPDQGQFQIPVDWQIAWVAQETPALAVPALDYVLAGDAPLARLQAELAEAEARHDGNRQARLHDQLAAIDGYRAPSRAAALLHGLGFSPEQQQWPVARFSGGWRMRLNLAQALMCRADLLLLDEPTNHLDMEAIVWLESYLRQYPATLMVISHDRDFLDATVRGIVQISQQRLERFSGGYSDFERQRAARLAQQQAELIKQQAERARIQQFVDRFRAKATKARQVQSRLKWLDRLETIAPAHADSPFHIEFADPGVMPSTMLSLQQARLGYNGQEQLRLEALTLMPGDRIGLLGPNGAGKSTLIRALAGELPLLGGERVTAAGLRLGYFAQHQLEQLDSAAGAFLHLQRLAPQARDQQLLDYLGGFGFSGERVQQPVAQFSGGERARLVLALLIWQKPNLLLLDEPTNHLDLEMRHALTLALQQFGGALVLVSHDRHLLRTSVDQFYRVGDGQALPFAGDLDDYLQQVETPSAAGRAEPEAKAPASTVDRKEQRRQAADMRTQLRPLRQKLQKAEQALGLAQQQLAELETRLADPGLYQPEQRAQLQEGIKRQGQLTQQIEALELEWLSLSEALEAAEQGLA